jgi:hypothetical protein
VRRRHAGAAPEIVDRGEGLVGPRSDDRGRVIIGETLHHAQAEPDSEAIFDIGRLERAIPAAGIDADRAHLDAMSRASRTIWAGR